MATAGQAVTTAEQELAEAQAALAAAQAAAAGTTPPPPRRARRATPSADPAASPACSRPRPSSPPPRGITDKTPLARPPSSSTRPRWRWRWRGCSSSASGCLADDQQDAGRRGRPRLHHTLQQALADAGYYDGKVDGVYGPKTVAAVEALQKANGLPQTGSLDKATEKALRSELAAKGARPPRRRRHPRLRCSRP